MSFQLISRRSFAGLLPLAIYTAGSKAFGEEAQGQIYALLSSNGTLYFTSEKPTIEQDINFVKKYRFETGTGTPWKDVAEQVYEVQFLSPVKSTSTSSWFSGMRNLKVIAGMENLDTSACTDMSYMFCNCSSLAGLDLSSFDTSACTDMSFMFSRCTAIDKLDLTNFDVHACRNMRYMFAAFDPLHQPYSLSIGLALVEQPDKYSSLYSYCTLICEKQTPSSLTCLDISSWDVSMCLKMDSMFAGYNALTDLRLWTYGPWSCTDMQYMFLGCSSLSAIDTLSFVTRSYESMCAMFMGCSSLTSLDLSTFDTSQVTDMSCMFANCSWLETVNLSSFNTSNCVSMNDTFRGCSWLASIDLSSFDFSNVTNYRGEVLASTDYMFQECSVTWF